MYLNSTLDRDYLDTNCEHQGLDPLCILTEGNFDLSDNRGFPPENMAGDPD